MNKRFEYRGDLAVTPLPEILATVHRYRVAGVVTLSRDGRVRRLFLEEGASVMLVGRSLDKLKETRGRLASDQNLAHVVADAVDEDATAAAVSATRTSSSPGVRPVPVRRARRSSPWSGNRSRPSICPQPNKRASAA